MSEEELNEMTMSRPRQCGRSRSEMLLTLATIHRREQLFKSKVAAISRGSGVKGNFDIKPIYI